MIASHPRSDRSLEADLDALYQVVREIEGVRMLEHLIPNELLWERPPGLPSTVELLWLIHLVDSHWVHPGVATLEKGPDEVEPPDYQKLLDAFPLDAKSLDDLHERIKTSRQSIIDALREKNVDSNTALESARAWIGTLLAHDRRVLSSLTERLYESGLGGH